MTKKWIAVLLVAVFAVSLISGCAISRLKIDNVYIVSNAENTSRTKRCRIPV